MKSIDLVDNETMKTTYWERLKLGYISFDLISYRHLFIVSFFFKKLFNSSTVCKSDFNKKLKKLKFNNILKSSQENALKT